MTLPFSLDFDLFWFLPAISLFQNTSFRLTLLVSSTISMPLRPYLWLGVGVASCIEFISASLKVFYESNTSMVPLLDYGASSKTIFFFLSAIRFFKSTSRNLSWLYCPHTLLIILYPFLRSQQMNPSPPLIKLTKTTIAAYQREEKSSLGCPVAQLAVASSEAPRRKRIAPCMLIIDCRRIIISVSTQKWDCLWGVQLAICIFSLRNFNRFECVASWLRILSHYLMASSRVSFKFRCGYVLFIILYSFLISKLLCSSPFVSFQLIELAIQNPSILANSSTILPSNLASSPSILPIAAVYNNPWVPSQAFLSFTKLTIVLIPETIYLFIMSLMDIFCMRSTSPSRSRLQFLVDWSLLRMLTILPQRMSWHLRQGSETIWRLWILRQDLRGQLQAKSQGQGCFGVCFFRVRVLMSAGGGMGWMKSTLNVFLVVAGSYILVVGWYSGVKASSWFSRSGSTFLHWLELRVKRLPFSWEEQGRQFQWLGEEVLSLSFFSFIYYYLSGSI